MAAKITNNLLKQAIADAEAVRETAVANAKLVLEEAITPQIRDMIARRLRVESDNINPDLSAGKEDRDNNAKEEPFEAADAVKGGGPEDTSGIGTGDNKEPSDASFDTSDVDQGGEQQTDGHTDWYDDWSESDFDLDEVIKELEGDIAALSHKEEGGEEEGEDHEASESPEEEKAEHEAAVGGNVQTFTKPTLSTEEDEEKEEPTEAPVAAAPMAPTAPTAAPQQSEEGEEEIDLEAILRELDAEADALSPEKELDIKKKMATELARLKSEMAQYREAVGILRGRLQEVNLLNAKLLFTNKMFRKDSLTNEQKVRIVESFDRATTVREVKLVYAALVENLATAAKSFNSRKKAITEGLASKATPSTAPKSKEVIVENTVAKRLQELAGII